MSHFLKPLLLKRDVFYERQPSYFIIIFYRMDSAEFEIKAC